MKAILIAISILLLASCGSLGVQSMSPEQIKATAGMATCTTATTIYGKAASVTVNTDDVRKGATSQGKTTVSCGDVTMTLDTNVGVGATGALPAPITTVTPMTVTPMTVTPTKPSP